MKMELNEALDRLNEAGASVKDAIGNVVDLSVLNSRIKRLDSGWHFIVEECHPTGHVYVIGKEGIGKFRFVVKLGIMQNPLGNDYMLPRVRLVSYERAEGALANIASICSNLFKEN